MNSYKNITDQDFLVVYYPEVSKEICESHGLDYFKVLDTKSKYNTEKGDEFKDVSLSTAAAVTSNARIFMSNIKLDIIKNGGSIYYTDTDSIVTDKPLQETLVGKKIGQFKLYEIKEAYFISSKTYCLLLKDRSVVIKVKGVNNNSLTIEDFKNMYRGINVKGVKQDTITNYEKGSVVISTKNIILNYNCYKKREKVYIDGLWVDTKPLIYSTVNRSFVAKEEKKRFNYFYSTSDGNLSYYI